MTSEEAGGGTGAPCTTALYVRKGCSLLRVRFVTSLDADWFLLLLLITVEAEEDAADGGSGGRTCSGSDGCFLTGSTILSSPLCALGGFRVDADDAEAVVAEAEVRDVFCRCCCSCLVSRMRSCERCCPRRNSLTKLVA